jgi:hypothetical protein
VGNGELIKQLTQLRFARFPGSWDEFQHGANVFLYREAAEDRTLLRQITNSQACPAVHGQMGDLRAIEGDPAAVGGNQARDHVENGRLAGAIGAQKPHGFTAPDGERDVAHHRPPLVGLAQALNDQTGTLHSCHAPAAGPGVFGPPGFLSLRHPVRHHVFITRQENIR